MPRTKRHITSGCEVNPYVDSSCSTGLNTSQPALLTDAQEHEEAPVQTVVVETTKPKPVRGRKRNTRMWDVEIKDGNGELKRKKLRAIDIFSLPLGERVVVAWNSWDQPVDSSVGLLTQFLGRIASNWENFPIRYEKWQKIPESYKDHVWNNIIKAKLEVNDDGHKDYIFNCLGKKWRDHRFHLYNCTQCDPDGSREASIAKKPLDYRANPDTKAKAKQNSRTRMNLTTSHTLGSKSFARLNKEMEMQLGQPVTRAELFQVNRTKSEGSFVNEEIKQNHEDLISQSQNSSENEAFTSVFGKDHLDYVRELGFGVAPTQVYGSSSGSSSKSYASGDTIAEIDALRQTVQQLSQQVQQNQQQIALLTQQLASQNPNFTPEQVNVGSPSIGRCSSQGCHSTCGEHNSPRTI